MLSGHFRQPCFWQILGCVSCLVSLLLCLRSRLAVPFSPYHRSGVESSSVCRLRSLWSSGLLSVLALVHAFLGILQRMKTLPLKMLAPEYRFSFSFVTFMACLALLWSSRRPYAYNSESWSPALFVDKALRQWFGVGSASQSYRGDPACVSVCLVDGGGACGFVQMSLHLRCVCGLPS